MWLKKLSSQNVLGAVTAIPHHLRKYQTQRKKRTHVSDKKDDDESGPEDDGDEEQEEEERVLLARVAVLLVERVRDPALIAVVEEVFPFSRHLLPGRPLFLPVPSARNKTQPRLPLQREVLSLHCCLCDLQAQRVTHDL